MVYSNTAVYGGNEYGKSGHLSIFSLLRQWCFWSFFFSASFLHIIKDTDSM